jgi:hypothetical protein
MQERRIGKSLCIVFKSDPGGSGDQLELAEGQINALEEGPDKTDGKRRNHRTQKEPEPAADRVFKNTFFQWIISLADSEVQNNQSFG